MTDIDVAVETNRSLTAKHRSNNVVEDERESSKIFELI